jgi:hypothetical protein
MNMTNRFSRSHTLLTAGVIGLAAAVSGCNQAASPVRPSASAEAASGGAITEARVGDDLAEVRQATVQFHDIAQALAAGYTTEFEPCVFIPGGPAMGVHARNEGLMADQIVDPLRPELLLYEPAPNGDLRLVGVEYFQVVLVHDGDPNTNDRPEPWTAHEPPPANRIVGPTPQLFGQRFDGPMEGHTPVMPWHWDLHAWIWQANPDGVFAPFHRNVRCP